MKIGVLAAQGAFAEHIDSLKKLKTEAVAVRLPRDLTGVNALIIPGGESTTISRIMRTFGLAEAIRARAQEGMPIFGTCAGMIVIADRLVDGNGVQPLRIMDITVRRNAFGRQIDSFETDLSIPAIGKEPFHGVFIRAPVIEQVGPKVEVLSRLEDGTVVAARQGSTLVSSFHPELTEDLRFHQYFLDIVMAS